jgi:hypothetical protein
LSAVIARNGLCRELPTSGTHRSIILPPDGGV